MVEKEGMKFVGDLTALAGMLLGCTALPCLRQEKIILRGEGNHFHTRTSEPLKFNNTGFMSLVK